MRLEERTCEARRRPWPPGALVLPGVLLAAGCSPWKHTPTEPRWLRPAPALVPASIGASRDGALRVAAYGDTRGNRPVHRAVVAAVAAAEPDVVVYTGDALDCLPVGHLPDLGAWSYLIPFWPQVHRRYPIALVASLVPFPAALHDTVGIAVAPPRDPDGFNAFLEDTAVLRQGGVSFLFVPGNHDLYHRWDRAALGQLLARPPDELWFSVDRRGYRFVVLDTGTDLFGDRDPIPAGGPQLRWLDEVLGDAERQGLRALVSFHIPPFSSGREEGSVPWVEERLVRGILDRHRVALVVNGHAHAYERVERPGPGGRPLTFIVTGGGGAFFFHEGEARVAGSRVFREGVRHFVLLDLAPDRIEGRMVPVAVPGEVVPPPAAGDAFSVDLAGSRAAGASTANGEGR